MKLSHYRNLSTLALIACLSACAQADHTVWLSPLNAVVSEYPGWENVTIRQGFPGSPGNAIRIQSAKYSDSVFIKLPFPLPSELKIKELTVCYQVSDSRSHIVSFGLSKQRMPSPAPTLVHNDGNDLDSTAPACYRSEVNGSGDIQTDGAITLGLRLHFADVPNVSAHYIDIGAIGIRVGPKEPTFLLATNSSEAYAGDSVFEPRYEMLSQSSTHGIYRGMNNSRTEFEKKASTSN